MEHIFISGRVLTSILTVTLLMVVVIHDIPDNSVAAGNLCNVIRQIDKRDSQYYFKDRMIDKGDLAEEFELRKNL